MTVIPFQIRHYKSDWHRYNLRQRLKGCKSVTEEQFEELSGKYCKYFKAFVIKTKH
jgi:hypothetical protein